jgi:quinol monooxygenase YgiN
LAPALFFLPEFIISIADSLRSYGLVLTHYRYKDMASMQAHGASDHYKELGSAIKQEDLLAEPIKVLFTKDVGGYTSKL